MKCPYCKTDILKGFYDGKPIAYEKYKKISVSGKYEIYEEAEAGDIIFKGWKYRVHTCFEFRE